MNKFPVPGTKEANEFLRRWNEANSKGKHELCYEFQGSYERACHIVVEYRNYKPPKDIPTSESRELNVNLPPVNLLKYKAPTRKRGDEEIAILHTSDGHAGKITKSFNKDVYRSRMAQMFKAVMILVNLHRNMYPIRRLLIFNTGDNIQGENPHQGSKIGEVEMGARDQVHKLAAPMWNDVLGSFSQEFEQVQFEGVPGNHGHEKLAPETSSYDLLLYDVLEAGIGTRVKNITINTHEEWYAIIEELNIKMFLFHGWGIPCHQGVPYFALDKKLKSWHMQFGGFRYAFSGHFHKSFTHEISSVLEHFSCSTLASDDNWALQKLGISSYPSQNMFGLHPRHGITWRYNLIVDDKYLPALPQTQALGND
ncbi:MAG: hypothetical protein ACFFD4_07785 [Candidatus Odinarchaeota archaeon]